MSYYERAFRLIKDRFEESGLTISDLSKLSQVDTGNLWRLMDGKMKGRISFEVVSRLLKALDIPFSKFDEDPPKEEEKPIKLIAHPNQHFSRSGF